ncbi:Attractin-like protein 1 [Varanus komodoensis]|nr:Attractin-like protein 1 [Varanus komodoensis]
MLEVRRCLAFYRSRTESVRRSNRLFVKYLEHDRGCPVTSQCLLKWIVNTIVLSYQLAKLDLPFTPRGHSTRAVAASLAFASGVPIEGAGRPFGLPRVPSPDIIDSMSVPGRIALLAELSFLLSFADDPSLLHLGLLIDYQFTFSLLQEDDRHHTAINFIANPEQSNKNLDISINASNNFNLNITWSIGSTAGTISGEEIPVVSRANIKEYRDSFSCEKFNFRSNPNITFYVYVSNFSWPIKIQPPNLQNKDLVSLLSEQTNLHAFLHILKTTD